MDIEIAVKEILDIRNRLEDIQQERDNLPDDAFAEKADLLDEQHKLQARLAELKSELQSAENEPTRESHL